MARIFRILADQMRRRPVNRTFIASSSEIHAPLLMEVRFFVFWTSTMMTRWIKRMPVVSLILIVVGCQASRSSGDVQLEGPTGRIMGVVIFAGRYAPTPTIETNEIDPKACGAKLTKLDVLIAQETFGVANVIVWLADVNLPEGYKPRRQDLRLATQRCQFAPRVAAMTVGSTISVKNVDTVEHGAELSGAQNETIHLAKNGN